jgi:hypothetical protein
MVRHVGILVAVAILLSLLPSSQSDPRASLTPFGSPVASPLASPVADGDALRYEAVLPAYRDEVASAADRLSRYTITAMLHPASVLALATPGASPVPGAVASPDATPVSASSLEEVTEQSALPARITGAMEVQFVNTTGQALPELYLRLYPNLDRYPGGGLEVREITVDGKALPPPPLEPLPPPPLEPTPSPSLEPLPPPPAIPSGPASPDTAPAAIAEAAILDPTVLRVPLPAPLDPGGTTTLRMEFITTVPEAPIDGSGIFGITPDTGTWVLSGWFPMLAGYGPVSSWELSPPSPWSDAIFSNAALFDVTLVTPPELVLATTGVQVDERMAGNDRVRRFTSGPAREFTVVGHDDFVTLSRQVDGTTVTVYLDPAHAGGETSILTWAAAALGTFNDLYGPYPYAELDVVDVSGIIGYEFSQMVFIGSAFFADPVGAGSRPDAAQFLVAHEVAHQWWYDLVGSNPHRYAFLDEGLAEHSALVYFEERYGEDRAAEQMAQGLTLRYATMLLTTGEDQVVDQPTAAFPDGFAYFTTVYRKAALGLDALRTEIGDEAFFAGLRAYAEAMRFKVATPADLRAAFEQASGRDLGAFWRSAFEGTEGAVSVVVLSEPGPATPEAGPAP